MKKRSKSNIEDVIVSNKDDVEEKKTKIGTYINVTGNNIF